MPKMAPRLPDSLPLKRLGHEWAGTLPVILLSRTTQLIADGPIRLDAGKLYCLPATLARELLASGLAVSGETEDLIDSHDSN